MRKRDVVNALLNRWTMWGGALLLLTSLWGALGFQTPVLSGEIHRLDKRQAEQAVVIYRGKVRSLITTPRPADPANAALLDEDLADAKRDRDAAEKRLLELSK